MNRDGYGLQHGRFGKRKTVRQVIHNSLRNNHVFRESPCTTVIGAGNSEHAALVAEIDFSASAIATRSARDRRIKSDSIAFGPSGYLRSDFRDAAGSFMAHNDWRNAPAGGAVVAMHVAAANTASRNLD